jgi:hypothetical protein
MLWGIYPFIVGVFLAGKFLWAKNKD